MNKQYMWHELMIKMKKSVIQIVKIELLKPIKLSLIYPVLLSTLS